MATELGGISEAGVLARPRRGVLGRWGGGLWVAARRKPMGAVAAGFLLLVVLGAIFAPLVTLNGPLKLFDGMAKSSPWSHPPGGGIMVLGGDEIGRDLFSRVIYGARLSLGVGFASVLMGITLGTAVGLASANAGGKVDLVVQRVVDSAQAIPGLILAMLVLSLLGTSERNVAIAIGLTIVPFTSRVVRGLVLSVKENVYVEAARAMGASGWRVAVYHILPNVTHGIIIIAATWLGAAILIQASLSFLGLGTPPPSPSWGSMVSLEGRRNMIDHPMLLAAPATALTLTVLAFNFLGDALRDLLDPRLRR